MTGATWMTALDKRSVNNLVAKWQGVRHEFHPLDGLKKTTTRVELSGPVRPSPAQRDVINEMFNPFHIKILDLLVLENVPSANIGLKLRVQSEAMAVTYYDMFDMLGLTKTVPSHGERIATMAELYKSFRSSGHTRSCDGFEAYKPRKIPVHPSVNKKDPLLHSPSTDDGAAHSARKMRRELTVKVKKPMKPAHLTLRRKLHEVQP